MLLLIIKLVDFLKVVTCGNHPLESSFQRVPRCVYTSTSLYEYRGWGSKPANPTHRRFTWGLRSMEVRKLINVIITKYSGFEALLVNIQLHTNFNFFFFFG